MAEEQEPKFQDLVSTIPVTAMNTVWATRGFEEILIQIASGVGTNSNDRIGAEFKVRKI